MLGVDMNFIDFELVGQLWMSMGFFFYFGSVFLARHSSTFFPASSMSLKQSLIYEIMGLIILLFLLETSFESTSKLPFNALWFCWI